MCTTVAWSFLDVIRSVALTLRRCFTNIKACILLLICRYFSQTLLRLCNQKIFMYYFNISKHLVLNCLVRYVHVDKNMCVIIRIEVCSKKPCVSTTFKIKKYSCSFNEMLSTILNFGKSFLEYVVSKFRSNLLESKEML